MCRAFKKRSTGQTKHTKGWDSDFFYDDSSRVSPTMDPIDYITNQPPGSLFSQSFMCKQELEGAENLKYLHSDLFIQLPQLESPSFPSIKRPSSISLVSLSENNDQEDDLPRMGNIDNNNTNNNKDIPNKVTDWRALDKFVASQLSQEDGYDLGEGLSSNFQGKENSDLADVFMEVGKEKEDAGGGGEMNGFLISRNQDECDIGICIFDK